MKTLYLFKSDLRLRDAVALNAASEESSEMLLLYVFDPAHYRELDLGFKKAGDHRLQFFFETLENLQQNLQQIGGELHYAVGSLDELVPKIVSKYSIELVAGETEYAMEETTAWEAMTSKLPASCQTKTWWGKTLYHLDDLPYSIENIPQTSKAFRINTTKKADVRSEVAAIKKIVSLACDLPKQLPSPKELGFEEYEMSAAQPLLKGGEQAALERLNYYTFESQNLTRYKWTRNQSMGMDYSSKLSAYLAVGAISPRTIYHTVKRYESEVKRNISTWWLIFEVMWRDFFTFKGIRVGAALYSTSGYGKKERTFTNDSALFQAWCSGKTGIPMIDAHMRMLNATGFMSNRGRVNCASFFVHDLQIDWTWGAAYFESKLIDYDSHVNWMNWHAQTYEIWYTNPIHQSLKYKLQDFIRKWVPELNMADNSQMLIPWRDEVLLRKTGYPKPVVVQQKWARSIAGIEKVIAKEET